MGAAALIPLLGMAVSVGGQMMQSNAQNAAIKAQNEEQRAAMMRQKQLRQQEDARQEQMRQQQVGLTDEALTHQGAEAVTGELTDTKGERAEGINKLSDEMAATSPGEIAIAARPGAAGDVQVVNDDLGARLAQAAQTTRAGLQAKSDLGAWGQLFGDRARAAGVTNEELNFINKKRSGSLDTAGVENSFAGQSFGSSIAPNSMGMALGSALAGAGNALPKMFAGGGYG